MSEYAGESLQKKIARETTYWRARALVTGNTTGGIVCLAGTPTDGIGGHDVGPIRAFFPDLPEDRVMFVDRDESALDAARARMSGAHFFHGDLADADPPWPVMLGVVDLTGHVLSDDNRPGVMNILRRLHGRGVAAITGTKARDGANTQQGVMKAAVQGDVRRLVEDRKRLVQRLARRKNVGSMAQRAVNMAAATALEPLDGPDLLTRAREMLTKELMSVTDELSEVKDGLVCRAVGCGQALAAGMGLDFAAEKILSGRGALTRPVLSLVWAMEYTASSPMMILLFRKERAIDAKRRGGGIFDAHTVPADINPTAVLHLIDEWGMTPEAFDVSPGTVAAWRAHSTMGTYRTE